MSRWIGVGYAVLGLVCLAKSCAEHEVVPWWGHAVACLLGTLIFEKAKE